MSNLKREIDLKEGELHKLERFLPRADFGQYGADKRRISELKTEIATLKLKSGCC